MTGMQKLQAAYRSAKAAYDSAHEVSQRRQEAEVQMPSDDAPTSEWDTACAACEVIIRETGVLEAEKELRTAERALIDEAHSRIRRFMPGYDKDIASLFEDKYPSTVVRNKLVEIALKLSA